MPYPSSVDANVATPAIISNEAIIYAASLTQTLTINVPFLYAFEISAYVTVTGMRWRNGATTTGTTNMALYTFTGNLVSGSDTGAITNVASSAVNATYGTAVTLAPGQYYLALASSNGTDTYMAASLASSQSELSRARQGSNLLSSGVMPSTLGTIAFAAKEPAVTALVSGGLS